MKCLVLLDGTLSKISKGGRVSSSKRLSIFFNHTAGTLLESLTFFGFVHSIDIRKKSLSSRQPDDIL
jgi:hypothetical protein